MHTPLPITALGLVTALGHDVVHCAAAHRAGFSFARALPGLRVEAEFEDDEHHDAAVSGHALGPLTDGFLQAGRWIRLGLAALQNLAAYGALPPPDDAPFWSRTALMVIVPDTTSERFAWPYDEAMQLISSRFVAKLLGLFGAPIAFDPGWIFTGHAGVAPAILAAQGLLAHGNLDRVIVLGVDSWVDAVSVGVLDDERRLKSPLSPAGMQPGEGAACFLVEREAVARHRAGRVEGAIVAAQHVAPPGPVPTQASDRAPFDHAVGRSLAAAASAVLGAAGVVGAFTGDLVIDLNGEEWKARVLSTARLLLRDVIDFDRAGTVFPCASFGEIGAASGPASVCLAVRAFARGYARAEKTLVLSIADGGEVAAVLLGADRHA